MSSSGDNLDHDRLESSAGGAWLLADVTLDGASNLWTGTEDPDTARGNGGDDTLRGLGGADELRGGTGHDVLDAGTGADSLYGWTGNDSAVFTDTGVYVHGGPGDDSAVFAGTGFSGSLAGLGTLLEIEHLEFSQSGNTLSELTAAQVVAVTDGRNDLTVAAASGVSAAVALAAGWTETGSGVYTAAHNGNMVTLRTAGAGVGVSGVAAAGVVFSGGDGNESREGGPGADTLSGGGGNDTLRGLDGADQLRGGTGDDVLGAGRGADSLYGWTGNDVAWFSDTGAYFYGGPGGDSAVFAGTGFSGSLAGLGTLREIEHLEFSQSGNTISDLTAAQVVAVTDGRNDLAIVAGSGISVTVALAAGWTEAGSGVYTAAHNGNTVTLRTTGTGVDVSGASPAGVVFSGGDGDESREGGPGADTLSGGGGNDTLRGLGGDDVLRGGTGDDVLDARGGVDSLYGGTGNDFAWFSDAGAYFHGGPGDDSAAFLETGFSGSLSGLGTFREIEELAFGFSGNTLRELTAAQVAAVTDGRNGLVITTLDDASVTVTLAAGWTGTEGGVYTAAHDGNTVTLRAISVGVSSADFAGIVFSGGDRDDVGDGGLGQDTLSGGDGNDLLRGFGGDDMLRGGTGDDALEAGTGADSLYGWTGNDLAWFSEPGVYIHGGPGDDSAVFLGTNFSGSLSGLGTMRAIERLSFNGYLSRNMINDLTAAQVAEVTDGRNDLVITTLNGAGVTVTLAAGWTDMGGGVYRAAHNGNMVTLRAGERVGVSGASSVGFVFSGGDGDESREGGVGADTLSGGGGNDTLSGLGGADQLRGGTGDDVLDAGDGVDSLYGGTGNDLAWFADTSVYFHGGPGGDSAVFSGTGFSGSLAGLGALQEIEHISFGQPGNTISGLTTAHVATITDERNDLVIAAGNGVDVTVSLAAGWTDTGGGVYTAAHDDNTVTLRTMGAGVAVSGATGIVFSGRDADESREGGPGADTFSGGGGDDTLLGQAGNDVLRGGTGHDILDAGTGADSVYGWTGNDSAILDDTGVYFHGGPGDDSAVFAGTGFSGSLAGLGTLREIEHLSFSQPGNTISNLTAAQVAIVTGGSNDLTVTTVANGNKNPAISAGGGGASDTTLHLATGWEDMGQGVYTATHDGNTVTLRATGVGVSGAGSAGIVFFGGNADESRNGDIGADTLSGGDGNDSLSGQAGNDVLRGGAGDDFLEAGTGADSMYGGAGDDSGRFTEAGAYFHGGPDHDGAGFSGTGFSGGLAELGTLREIEYLFFFQSGNTISDLTAAQVAEATDARNNLAIAAFRGTSVTIRLAAGWTDAGSDVYTATHDGKTVTLWTWGEGVDVSGATFVGVVFSGGDGDESRTGDVHADTLGGNGGNDSLSGQNGDDVLRGGAGDDVLDAGSGADSLYGWTGNDSAVFMDTGAYFHGGPGDDSAVFAGTGYSGSLAGLGTFREIEQLSFTRSGNTIGELTAAQVAGVTDGRNDLTIHGGTVRLAAGWTDTGSGVYTAAHNGNTVTLTLPGSGTAGDATPADTGPGGEADPGGELAWLPGGDGGEPSGAGGEALPASGGVLPPDSDDSPLIA